MVGQRVRRRVLLSRLITDHLGAHLLFLMFSGCYQMSVRQANDALMKRGVIQTSFCDLTIRRA